MTRAILGLALLAGAARAEEPAVVKLWPNGAPGVTGTGVADVPTLTVFLPAAGKATGAAAVITPGGGYASLSMDLEGYAPAKWLAERGVAGFVLRSRLCPPHRHPAPLHDAQRALRLVRSRAAEWGLDPAKVGIFGFSAGGHLASTALTHFDAGDAAAVDSIDRQSCRPAFGILAYPLVSLADDVTHPASRKNLLGDRPDPKTVEEFSNHLKVTKETPPTYLFHTAGDNVVFADNSILFYQACRKAKVPCELHILEHGGHGVGMGFKDPKVGYWPDSLHRWLLARNLAALPAPGR